MIRVEKTKLNSIKPGTKAYIGDAFAYRFGVDEQFEVLVVCENVEQAELAFEEMGKHLNYQYEIDKEKVRRVAVVGEENVSV